MRITFTAKEIDGECRCQKCLRLLSKIKKVDKCTIIEIKCPKCKLVNTFEIKSRVIATINKYFDINVWDFGETFFFSELSAYLHKNLGDILASVVIVSKDTTKSFGDLYEIRSQPHEIFISSATVNDIEIIDALTNSELQVGVEE